MRRATWIAAACALLLLAGFPALAATVPDALRERAHREGRVRVLVRLALPAAPEAALPPAAAARQRAAFARAAEAATAGLGPAARASLRRPERLPILALEATPEDLAELAAAPEVAAVAEDRLLAPALDDSVPLIGADLVHDDGYLGGGSAVAVLDTGVDAGHPFLAGALVAEACFSGNRSCPNGQFSQVGPGAGSFCTWAEGCFHGTHVAGIALGAEGSLVGVAPAASLVSVQVFSRFSGASCEGAGEDPCSLAYTSDLVAGLDWVASLAESLPVASVNMSLSGGRFTSEAACDTDLSNAALKLAVDDLRAAGVVTVAASGNDGWSDALGSPACISSVVGVGAIRNNGSVWGSSNSAPFLDLLAPGVGVTSAVPPALVGFDYGSASGTSMAAPHVAGALALLREAGPAESPDDLVAALASSGLPVLDPRNGVVRPRIQVDAAVVALDAPACANGRDDDGDGLVDHPDDPGCAGPGDLTEGASRCGLGFELAAGLPLLRVLALRRRRRGATVRAVAAG